MKPFETRFWAPSKLLKQLGENASEMREIVTTMLLREVMLK